MSRKILLSTALVILATVGGVSHVHAQQTNLTKTAGTAAPEGTKQAEYIANIAYLIIPIVIMWTGILGSSMVSDGASKWVVGMGQRISRGAANKVRAGGKYIAVTGAKGVAYAPGVRQVTGRAAGLYGAAKYRLGGPQREYEKIAKKTQDVWSASGKAGRTTAAMDQFSRAVSEAEKKLENLDPMKWQENIKKSSNKAEVAASARLLSSRGMLGTAELTSLSTKLDSKNKDGEARKVVVDIENNLKKNNKRGTLAVYAKGGTTFSGDEVVGEKGAMDKYFGDMSVSDLAKQDIQELRQFNDKKMVKDRMEKSVNTIDNVKAFDNATTSDEKRDFMFDNNDVYKGLHGGGSAERTETAETTAKSSGGYDRDAARAKADAWRARRK